VPYVSRTSRSGRHFAAAVIAAVAALLVFAILAEAHDFWLVPDAFRVAAGEYIEVRGQTSSKFPTSESAVALDRIADARVIGSPGSERITELSHSGTSLLLRHRPTTPGQRLIAVTLRPRSVRESSASFRRYLELEGAPEALARIDREGLLRGRDSLTRRYAKYAKTLVEVGSGGPRVFSHVAGHPLEFVPVRDPAAHRVGDTIEMRLLYAGQPLPRARLHAGVAPAPGGRAELAANPVEPDVHLTTDADGRFRLRLAREGLWNVRTIHVVKSEANSGAEWDTHWATLVFFVSGSGEDRTTAVSSAGVARSDSAAVVSIVERYHRALETGDSTAALALLTSDAIILESGGVETRAEYRAHHLPADITFARAVKSSRSLSRVVLRGEVAWVASTSTVQGEFRGRAVNSAGAELMVLVRGTGGWQISAIHWSSRARRPSP
jgi:uncharacterized GH25 family protein/ketosteroid isomerase-like protein